MTLSNHFAAVAAFVACFGLAACAATLPPPTDTLAQASAAINRADAEGAADHAPQQLQDARNAYDYARELTAIDDNKQARYAAELAIAHAQLAQAMAEAERASQRADRADENLARVRREISQQREQP